MEICMNQLTVYTAPQGFAGSNDYTVRVRTEFGDWKSVFAYEVKVDMHHVQNASMVSFDFEGTIEVEVTCHFMNVDFADLRPLSENIPIVKKGNVLSFKLNQPKKLSLEINGDRFKNLHIFANEIEKEPVDPDQSNVLVLQPAIHRTEDILRLASSITDEDNGKPAIIYFSPGMHYLEEGILRIPSDCSVYLAGGSVVVGSLVCDSVKNVTIAGRGFLYLTNFERFTAFRGVRIVFSKNIKIEGITTIDPPHYSIYIGQSEDIKISNFKSFSSRGWSDGIDIMSSSNLDIEDVFLRTSDDCIAIYGSRWDYRGDTRNVTVRDSVLWADVAHPLMIGTHGDADKKGDIIENILFENIDILEHHEPQSDYWGAMAINAGDKNTVRDITYRDIRVEEFELGQLFDIRVVWNKKYNPAPGTKIENVYFENIEYNGKNTNPSRVHGFSKERTVQNIYFDNVRINGEPIKNAEQGNFDINQFGESVFFK
jgi:hypothetical protein